MPAVAPAVRYEWVLRVMPFARGPERMELLFFLAALMVLGFRFVSKTALITPQHLSRSDQCLHSAKAASVSQSLPP